MSDAVVNNDLSRFEPRRRPSQERSRRRFQAILQAARKILVEVGIESFTCEQVANRAEVPIGTLYQFFANKYVIVCELDRQDLSGVQTELERFAQGIPSRDWGKQLENFIDHIAQLWHTDPSRRAVWLAMQATPYTRMAAAEHERQLASRVTRLLAPLTPGMNATERQDLAEVLIHIMYSMMNFSVRSDPANIAAIKQTKAMVTAYLQTAGAEAEARRDAKKADQNASGEQESTEADQD